MGLHSGARQTTKTFPHTRVHLRKPSLGHQTLERQVQHLNLWLVAMVMKDTSHPNWNSTGVTATVIWVSLVSDFHVSGCHMPVLASQKSHRGSIGWYTEAILDFIKAHPSNRHKCIILSNIYSIFSWPEVHQYTSLDSRFSVLDFVSQLCSTYRKDLKLHSTSFWSVYIHVEHELPMNPCKKGRFRCCEKSSLSMLGTFWNVAYVLKLLRSNQRNAAS